MQQYLVECEPETAAQIRETFNVKTDRVFVELDSSRIVWASEAHSIRTAAATAVGVDEVSDRELSDEEIVFLMALGAGTVEWTEDGRFDPDYVERQVGEYAYLLT